MLFFLKYIAALFVLVRSKSLFLQSPHAFEQDGSPDIGTQKFCLLKQIKSVVHRNSSDVCFHLELSDIETPLMVWAFIIIPSVTLDNKIQRAVSDTGV